MSSFVVHFLSQISGVISQAEDISGPMEETVEASFEHYLNASTQDPGATEPESSSQPPVNVSQGIRFIVDHAEPQGCPALSSCKTCVDTVSSEENSQAPARSGSLVSSQQPSPEHLKSLGIKVRDFAYESTLPAIRPVSCSLPRVRRQRQPAVGPRAPKRPQRDWDVQEGPSNSLLSPQPLLGKRGYKKARCLERKATEPLEESEPPRSRILGGRTLKRLYSIVTSPRKPLPTSIRRFSASPPTSPLTPLSHVESQESELVQTPPRLPFVVRVEDTSVIPALQLDSGSQPISHCPSVGYTKIMVDTRPSLVFSSTQSPAQHALPMPLINSFFERPHLNQESGTNLRTRKRRGRGTASTMPPLASHRYYLRQRPPPALRIPAQSRISQQASSTPRSQARRTGRVR